MINKIKELITNDLKTLIIIDNKYHNLLYKKLLEDNQVLFNVSILSIDSFMQNTLLDNKINIADENNLISKLNIHQKLIEDNHKFRNNVNFINELAKLEKEFNLSNIEYNDDYGKHLKTHQYNFNNLNIIYNQVIILSYDNFYPIHYEFIDSLNTKIYNLSTQDISSKKYYEHPNTIKMLDNIILDLYNNQDISTLIICDDSIQQDYITNSLNDIGLSYFINEKATSFNYNILNSLFKLISDKATSYDQKNLDKMKSIDLDNIKTLHNLDYKDYIKELYMLLYNTNLIETDILNKTFSDLYLLDNINVELLDKLLFDYLSKHLTKDEFNDANITISSSNMSELPFDKVIIVDATMANLKAKKASYLLSNLERQEIDSKLINNSFYSELLKTKEQRLLNSGKDVHIHYSLLSIDNKPQDLAYFIKDNCDDNYDIEPIEQYYHLSSKRSLVNQLLLNNDVMRLDKDLMLERYNNNITISASSLDAFNSCYYKYFVSYLLKPSFSDEFNALTLGNIYHEIIEAINKELIITNKSYVQFDRAQLENFIINKIDDSFNNQSIILEIEPYKKDIIKDRIYNSILSFIDSMIYQDSFSKFTINQSELSLSYPFKNEYFNNVNIYGKIDALYEYDNNYYVLDYKSSAKVFSKSDFEKGLTNQLMIYLSLLQNNNYKYIGAFFKALKDNYVKSEHILDNDENEKLHLEKNKMEGILFENNLIEEFDYSLYSEDKSSVANITPRKIYSSEDLRYFLDVLNNHCNTMLKIINDSKFEVIPFKKSICDNCNYKAICKVNDPIYREELEDE